MIKRPLKPFVSSATAWKQNNFIKARVKLTTFYLLIMAGILVLFSILIFWYAEFSIQKLPRISQNEAYQISARYYPQAAVDDLYFDKGQYRVLFTNGYEIAINAFTAKVFPEGHNVTSWQENFSDDFINVLLSLNIAILVLCGFAAYFLSGRTLRPIQEQLKEQEQFVSNSSHELRNPLSAIQASAESVLRMQHIPREASREVLTDILEESRRLIALSESLLMLDTAKNTKQTTKCELASLTHKNIKKLSALANEKNISFTTDLTEYVLNASEEDLEVIIFNILHNAVKFSHKGGVVDVTLNSSGMFTVRDGGVGIDKEHISHVFERFYKANAARSFGRESGSGLGLCIVKELVLKYKGTINIVSERGRGTTVVISF